jgi:hypothetical protein
MERLREHEGFTGRVGHNLRHFFDFDVVETHGVAVLGCYFLAIWPLRRNSFER